MRSAQLALVSVAVVLVAALAGEPPSPPAIDVNNDVFLASTASQSCVTSYNTFSLAQRRFAFDGTVTSIDREAGDPFATVTFRVHRWFRYGARDHVVVAMLVAPYRVGSHMLVSGEIDGRLLAWGCGFTRWYDRREALVWHRVFDFRL